MRSHQSKVAPLFPDKKQDCFEFSECQFLLDEMIYLIIPDQYRPLAVMAPH
jgi:hypothetical protein